MINKILVALDTHEPYTHIFNQALDLAKATGAELKLLSIFSTVYDLPTGYYPGPMGYTLTMSDALGSAYQTERRKEKESILKVLSELKTKAEAQGVQAEVIQASGDPGVVICDRAKAEQADLIIVGSHGRRGLDELLVGSVSSYVMHRASCSVMIVHGKSQTKETLAESAVASAA